MKKNTLYIIASLAVILSGCNFLDHEPDMRATIDTKEKVRLLLVSAYPYGNAGPICEFSSDNIIDNNAPNATGHSNSLNPLDQMYNEIFGWQPVVSSGYQDSPKYIWDACYSTVATANQALKAIAELEAQGINMDAEKGEAYLCRAYAHFVLANVFCQAWKNDELSKNDLGITYMTAPETTVAPHYERGSLYETYSHIEEDLETGLKLVSDEYYSVAKYHFNVKAAHAFAARFYLYKREYDKVLEHANYVLGTTDETVLNSLYEAAAAYALSNGEQELLQYWSNVKSASNLLLYTTNSQAFYTAIPTYGRYQLNGDAFNDTFYSGGPCWSSLWPGFPMWMFSQEYGNFSAKFRSIFEYTDKVNGYGFLHGITRAFTTNETLLCRAEAKVFLNDQQGAVNDLRLWAQGYQVSSRMDTLENGNVNLTLAKIQNFYTPSKSAGLVPVLHNTDMSPDFVVTDAQKPLIWCVLHFRRIETIHDGLRWQDLKRYGIEITHKQGTTPLKTLVWNDDRRAIQLPQEVIQSGMTANPREILGDTNSSDVVAPLLPGAESSELQKTPNYLLTAGVPSMFTPTTDKK